MSRRLITLLLIAAVISLSSCGGDDGSPSTSEPEASTDDIEVIEAWAEAISESDMEAAAEYFAIPSVAENGITVDIETRDDAVLFNESLPCGAELESTEEEGEFITVTFRLKQRPGVPSCPGDGGTAETSFVIEDGAIVEWRRVALPGPGAEGQPA
ncbi:MAG TPA: hypothetical protein VD766_04535 [Solirubrobacterales bacterium]|nr:hypothetical protein [Solirubrobacterales bacterium]